MSHSSVRAAPRRTARFRQEVTILRDAALEADPEACKRAVDRLRKADVAPEQIAERLIPEAARQIGKQWMENKTCFADVTIATSKLQAVLRYLGPDWGVESPYAGQGPTILLMVPAGCEHTLGAMVVLGQLRRLGCSVRLILGARAETVKVELSSNHFDAIMISAAPGVSTLGLRRIVQAVRRTDTGDAPILIGGGILDTEPDLLRLTGADHAESDPNRALKLCRVIEVRGEKHLGP